MSTIPTTAPPEKPEGFFAGWYIVGVSILLMATIFGTIINSFSLFTGPVTAELQGISIREFSYAYSVITFIAIPFSPLVGNLLKKVDARWIVTIGIGAAVIANLVLSGAQNVWWIYGAALLQGVAIVFATTIPISTMITNWFVRKRGTALGIATAGSGLGSLIYVPLIQFFLLPQFGWRGTYIALAVIQVILLAPLSVLVLRNRPEQRGRKALGHATVRQMAGAAPGERPGLTQRQVYRSPAFWFLGAALIFSGVSVNGMISNLVPLLGVLGSSQALIGFVLGSLGLFIMLGKFVTGVLFDKLKLMLAIVIVALANAMQFFFMLNPAVPFNAVMFALLHGFGATMVTVTPAYLASKLFGEKDYSGVYSVVSIFALIGAGVAPIFGGFFFGAEGTSDQSHGHTLVWAWLIMGLIGLGLYIVTVLVRPKWESATEPEVDLVPEAVEPPGVS